VRLTPSPDPGSSSAHLSPSSTGRALSDALYDRVDGVATFEHRRCAVTESIPRRHVPAERVGQANDHVEERADRGGIAERLIGHAGAADFVDVCRRQLVGAEGLLLEEEERRGELGA
jgi:hypothetical protein